MKNLYSVHIKSFTDTMLSNFGCCTLSHSDMIKYADTKASCTKSRSCTYEPSAKKGFNVVYKLINMSDE